MQPKEALDKLQVLTLAVQDAINLDNWTDVNTLITQREAIITQLEQSNQKLDPTQFEELANLDKQTMLLMAKSKATILEQVRGTEKVAQARKAYTQPKQFDAGHLG